MKKLVGILVCLMMLATILPITAMAQDTSSGPKSSDGGLFEKTTIRGIVLFKRTADKGDSVRFFAIRLHYSTIKITGERENGVIKLQPIVIPNSLNGFYGKFFVMASFRGSLNV
jgi:hypothetical protein